MTAFQIDANLAFDNRDELIDAINVSYDYGSTQDDLRDHVLKNELSLVPNMAHLRTQKQVL